MSISVSTMSMGFENKELFMNSAKNTMQSNEVVAEKNIANNTQNLTYTNGKELNTQQYILLASTQITLNETLKETLKYLRTHQNYSKKEHKFGDIWAIMNTENEGSEKNPYEGELLNIEIEYNNSKNIFAA